jgi:hypothetical protein
VSDDVLDLMNASLRGKDTLFLDQGHDDYFEAHIAGCLDLADSAFLDPPGLASAPPPGWGVPLVAQPCEREAVLRPQVSETAIGIDFINSTPMVVQVYRLDSSGDRQLIRTLQPGDHSPIGLGFTPTPTYVTHPWVMTDATGGCLAVFAAEAAQEARGYRTFAAILNAPPSVRLGLNATRFSSEQTLIVGVDAQNPGDRPAADLYVGALFPDGRTVAFLGASGIVAGIRSLSDPGAFLGAQAVPPGTDLSMPSFFQFRFPTVGVGGGTYQFFAALVRQGAFLGRQLDPGDILGLDLQPVTFSP